MKYFKLNSISFYLGDISRDEAIQWILDHHPYRCEYVEENLIEIL